MYCTFYGLKERPFTLTPNPEFIFLGAAHQEAFAHLMYGIDQKAGFIALTGEVGAGKTTVVRTMLTRLEPVKYATALILNPMLSVLGLLKAINREFGITDSGTEPAELVDSLNAFLLEQKKLNKIVVLVIDEAQDMEPAVLEQVRLLSNLETATEKLIQIVLVGQPELETLLARDDMRQLNQRITVRYHVMPMSASDTRDYLTHRLRAANGKPDMIRFSDSAARQIYNFAGGLPRLVNAVADRCLLIGYSLEQRQIDDQIVRQAIKEVAPDKVRRKKQHNKRMLVTILLAIILLLSGALLWSLALRSEQGVLQTSQTQAMEITDRTEQLLTNSDIDSLNQASLNTMLQVWKLPVTRLPLQGSLENRLKQAGLESYQYNGNLGKLAKSSYPSLLELSVNGRQLHLFFCGLEQDLALVLDEESKLSRIKAASLEAHWSGKAIIPWLNSFKLQIPCPYNTNQNQRRQLVDLMVAAGAAAQPGPDSVPNEELIRNALLLFQRKNGLKPDGVAGAQTLLMLYSQAAGIPQPDLKIIESKQP